MATERTVLRSYATPANLLTFSRLIFLPVVIYGLVAERHWIAVGAMLLAVLTDLLDGRVARLMGQGGTRFGEALDSTIDFVLIYSLFIAFYASGHLAHWQFAVLYLAMLSILMLQLFQEGAGQHDVAGTRLGKPLGALQYAYALILVVMEIPALQEPAWVQMAHSIYFAILTVAIVLNATEIVGVLARLPERSRNVHPPE